MESGRTRINGPALEKMHQFLLWLVPTVDKMPRAHKFTLGDRIQNTWKPVAQLMNTLNHIGMAVVLVFSKLQAHEVVL